MLLRDSINLVTDIGVIVLSFIVITFYLVWFDFSSYFSFGNDFELWIFGYQ